MLSSWEIIHAYLGYVRNPKARGLGSGARAISRQRLHRGREPILRRNEDSVMVATFGGSVAKSLALDGADAMVEQFKRSPQFAEKKIVVVSPADCFRRSRCD